MPTTGQRESERKQAADHADLIAAIWRGMASIYGKMWAQYDNDDAREMWAMGLRLLSRDVIVEGMRRLRDSHTGRFPPNLPEFRELCLAPIREAAFDELVGWLRGGWFTIPAAYAVWLRRDGCDWQRMPVDTLRRVFEREFAALDLCRLPPIPEVSKVPQIEHKPISRPEGRKRLDELRRVIEQNEKDC